MVTVNKMSRKLILGLSTCLLLSACGSTTRDPNAPSTPSQAIDSALNRAASSASAQGDNMRSLAYTERVYKRNSDDPMAATNYAAALRENGYLEQAELVISPVAHGANAPSPALAEFAALQLAQGNQNRAETFARKAVEKDPTNHKAHHYLGIALDAQAKHEEAEKSFRNALDHWQGDPTPVMNNLALNLTSQGYLNEAAEILYKAKSIAPDRLEVERNLRIVTALQQSHSGNTPKPVSKPRAAEASKEIETSVEKTTEVIIPPSSSEEPQNLVVDK